MRWARFSTLIATVILLVGFAWGNAVRTSASATKSGDLASPYAIDQYLVSIGVDPGTAIWQVGPRNYVGPTCPGAGWRCIASTHTAVVQEAPLDGVNAFTCSVDRGAASQRAARCVVVQVNAGSLSTRLKAEASSPDTTAAANYWPGHNLAVCAEYRYGQNSPALCTITQSNGTGQNQALVWQLWQEQSGDAQTVSETANVTQANVSGQNQALVYQQSQQQIKDAATSQDQEATEFACIQQDSQSGQNQALIEQQLQQTEQSTASPVTQYQNIHPGTNNTCGNRPETTEPNLGASIQQDESNPGTGTGHNQAESDQSFKQNQQSSTKTGSVTQQEGSDQFNGANPPNDSSGGSESDINQDSTGVSQSTVHQQDQEQQQAQTTGLLSQSQYDAPHCCSNQASNSSDQLTLTQSTSQSSDPGASQNYDDAGDCTSSGTCSVTQQITQDGHTMTNTCSSSVCNVDKSNEDGG
jgi:hypothetical protein